MIKKHPELPSDFLKKEQLFRKGRTAFLYCLNSLNLESNDIILLPAYIGITEKEGSGVFDPIQSKKLKFIFYRINNDFSVDLPDLYEKINGGVAKAILIIHYFGFPQPAIDHIAKVCKEKKIALIEDCAHAPYTVFQKKNLGSYGDLSFNSLHKFFPIPDGAGLQINNPSIILPKVNEQDKISFTSLELLGMFDIDRICSIRIDNYNFLVKILKNIKKLTPVHPILPKGTVPLNCPVLITSDEKSRETLYFELLDKGVETVALYYRIISVIKKQQFPNSYYLSDHILNLPIHQDITKKDIEIMVKTLKKCLE